MADRYYENCLPDYSPQLPFLAATDEPKLLESHDNWAEEPGACPVGAIREPLFPTSQQLVAAALKLKNQVVQETCRIQGMKIQDPTMYTGMLGTAFLCFRAYQTVGNEEDLALCVEIIDRCAVAARSMKQYVTFICGQAGIYAMGVAIANWRGDKQQMDHYLGLFNQVASERDLSAGPSEGGLGMPYELLYGRAGFLWAALFINKYVGNETIPWSILGPIVDAMLAAGRAGSSQTSCPLMYQWHGTRYWGAAHGLAGIMHVLLHFPLGKKDAEDVKETLRHMIKNQFSSGNYPSSEGNRRDSLVHFCHGAPGIAMTFCKAAQVFPVDIEFKEAAISAGEVVWRRGLLRRVGLCHGVSGNTYVFLALYRLTGDERHLHRAKCFSSFLYNDASNLILSGEMHGGDHPHSLFEGLAGTACLWLDMLRPEQASFPGYEL